MVDEDFMLGIACGDVRTDEGCSGGEYSDIVIYRQYDFGSSGYGIAIPDFTKGNRFIIPYTLAINQPDLYDTSTWTYGPVNSREVYPQVACMTYSGQVRGYYASSDYAVYWENYSYVNGSFRLNNEKFAPTLISAELYKKGSDIYEKVEFKLSENGSVRTIDRSVLHASSSPALSRNSSPTGHGGDEFFRTWTIAFLKNGITGICDPINPYAE